MFFGKKKAPPAPETNSVNAAPVAPAAPAQHPAGPAPALSAIPPASAATPAANGTNVTPLPAEEAKKRAQLAKHVAASFGEIVTLLMHSPSDRQRPIHELERLVVPALLSGQFVVAEAQSKETGAVMPVGAVLWAFVSPEVDKRLSDLAATQTTLAPNEWRSGDIPWVVLALGDAKVLGGLLQQLTQNVFKGKPAKIRAKGADGKLVVGRIELNQPAA